MSETNAVDENKNQSNGLLKALRPMQSMCTVIGLSPYQINNRGQASITTASTRRCFASLIFQIAILCIIEATRTKTEQNIILRSIISIQDIVCESSNVLFIILEYVNRKRAARVLRDLQHCEDVITFAPDVFATDPSVHYAKVKRLHKRFLVVMLSWIAFTMYLSESVYSPFVWKYYLWDSLLYFGSMAAAPLTLLKFFTFNGLVKARLELINGVLNSRRLTNRDKQVELIIGYNNAAHCERSLRLCHYLHTKLHRISKRLNSIFSIQIIFYIALTFVVGITQLYYVAIRIIQPEPVSNTQMLLEVLDCVNWGSYHFVGVVGLCACCAAAANEAARTAKILHRIHNNAGATAAAVGPLKEQIEMWSLQLLHEKFEYTAGGLFNLDMTLVYAMIGSMTTYLVILIQFNLASMNVKHGLQVDPSALY